MHIAWLRAALVSLFAAGALWAADVAAVQSGSYTILSREGRRPLPYRAQNGQDMVALADVATTFGMTVREDVAAGGIVVTAPNGQTIVLTPGQPLASAGGRVVSLPAPPARDGRAWLVPIEFVGRAVGPVLGTRVDVRKGARLIVVGDLRVPQVSASIEGDGARARVRIDVTPSTPRSVTQEGRQLIVRFEADALDFRAPQAGGGGLVAAIRPSDAAQNLIVELGPRAGEVRTSTEPRTGGDRVVIEIAAEGTPLTPPPAETPVEPLPAEPPPLPDLTAAGGLRTIVIDPGHGGDDTGARGAGATLEKDVTLAIARRVKGAIEARLGVRVLLTRDGDRAMRVDERTSLANNNKADLFISLHANAAATTGPTGAEVFSLAREGYAAGAPAAAGTTATLPVFGGGTRSLEIIPWDTAQMQWLPESERLSRVMHAELAARVPMNPHALDKAPFRVLIGANMPAVLIETGFLTNPEQAQALAGDALQNDIAQAIVSAIVRYRDGGDAIDAPSPGGGATTASLGGGATTAPPGGGAG